MNPTEELLQRRGRAVSGGVGRLNRLAVARAEGAVLYDLEGREYLDLASGIGVMNVGHSHPAVLEAVRRQAGLLQHTCIHVATYEPYVALCEKLNELFPHGPETKSMLVNSGAEAVENAVKIARQATGRPAVLTFTEGFHGRTLLASSLTSKVGYKLGCGPFAPEVYRLPFPNRSRYGAELSPEAFLDREKQRFLDCFTNSVAADQVAAVIIEPLQGEGGFNVAPPGYLQFLSQACRERGIMVIFDEVQSGFCRTGRWAAYQHSGVVPDLSTWAKAMGGGFPISSVIGRADVMDAALPGTLGGTYGGNPVACAAALAAIEVMEKEQLNQRADQLGALMRQRLEVLQRLCPALKEVRGLGAMLAAEFDRPVAPLLERCLEAGVLALSAGAEGRAVRFLPPLVITEEQLGRALDTVEIEACQLFA